MESSAVSEGSFDPLHQTLTLLTATGEPISITIDDIFYYATWGAKACINYGSQLGASGILLLVLLLLANGEKRRSLIFLLNAFGLVINIIKLGLLTDYYLSSWNNPYAFFSYD